MSAASSSVNLDIFCIFDEIRSYVALNYNTLIGDENVLKVIEDAKTQSVYKKIWDENNYSEKDKNITVFSVLYLLLFLTETI